MSKHAKQGLPLGIDVGGSGIKGAPSTCPEGRSPPSGCGSTPRPASTPEAVAEVIDQIVDHFEDVRGDSPIGVTIPGVVTHGVVRSAANIDKSWLDFDAEPMLEKVLGHDIVLVNDADAAGVAELHYGAAKGQKGLVVMTTLGTGIGSALIFDGMLIPNSELGHLEIDGFDAESRAASSIKDKEGLSYPEWARAAAALLQPRRGAALARPVRRRRRGLQGRASSSCRCSSSRRPIVAADPPEQGRHHRCGEPRCRGPRGATMAAPQLGSPPPSSGRASQDDP